MFVSLWEYQKSQESARSCALSQPIWACLFNCCQNPSDYRNEYPNCTWPSQIKSVVSYFTSGHRPSSLELLVTVGTWVTDEPNVLISILQPSAGLCSEAGGPLGAVSAPRVQTIVQAELLAWKYLPGNVLRSRPFPVLCFAEEWGPTGGRLCSSHVSWALLPFPLADPFAGYVFIAPSLSSVQAELFISWLYVTRCVAVVSGVNPQPSAELKIGLWCLMCRVNGTWLFWDFWLSQNQTLHLRL